MGQKTTIPWTDYTSNPVRAERKDNGKRGHACIKVSEECEHCYAEALNKRWGTGLPFDARSMRQVTLYLNEKEVNWLTTSKAISGKRVFIEDMADLFAPWIWTEWIERLFEVFVKRQDVTFQLLTKWPQRMAEFLLDEHEITPQMKSLSPRIAPMPNVWLGTTAGLQSRADQRIKPMMALAAHRWKMFVSSEPRTGPINWVGWEFLELLITGGESGAGARFYDEAWGRSDLAFCREYGIKFFMKQLGGYPDKRERMEDFPEDLRVRDLTPGPFPGREGESNQSGG